MRSPEVLLRGPMRPLLAKEMREIAGGRALWIMLLLLCGLVGFSFLQAAELYGEASSSAPSHSELPSFASLTCATLVTEGQIRTPAFPFVRDR